MNDISAPTGLSDNPGDATHDRQNENAQDLVLIMKGGGIKGLAYIGALEVLTKYYSFNWYAGTSAGAITAVLLSTGYSVEELKGILDHNFNDFKDANFLKKWINLFQKGGLYEANTFTSWISDLIQKKLDKAYQVQLRDLPSRTKIYASRREKSALVFDSNDPGSNAKPAAYAVRCSMSIPLIFTPQWDEGLRVFDGGAQNNFPVKQILEDDPSIDFIGLYLGSETYENKTNSTSILGDLLSMWTEADDYEALRKYESNIVVIDPRPISTLKFKLSDEEKEFLLDAGRLGAMKFLKKHRNHSELQKSILEFETRVNKSRLRLRKRSYFGRVLKTLLWGLVLCCVPAYFYLPNFEKVVDCTPFQGAFTTLVAHYTPNDDPFSERVLHNLLRDYQNLEEVEAKRCRDTVATDTDQATKQSYLEKVCFEKGIFTHGYLNLDHSVLNGKIEIIDLKTELKNLRQKLDLETIYLKNPTDVNFSIARDADVLSDLINCLTKYYLGEYEDALSCFATYLEGSQHGVLRPYAQFYLANTNLHLSNYSQALEIYENDSLLTVADETMLYYNRAIAFRELNYCGRLDSALASLDTITSEDSLYFGLNHEGLDLMFEEAFRAYDNGDVEKCVEAFKCLLNRDHRSCEAYVYLARMMYDQKLFSQSIRYYDDAEAHHVDDCFSLEIILSERARSKFDFGEDQKCIDDYTRCIEIDKKSSYFFGRALAYSNLGDFWSAIDDYDTILSSHPRYAAAHHNRAVSYDNLGFNSEALDGYNTAIELDSTKPLYFYNRSTQYEELNDSVKARSDLLRAIRASGNSEEDLWSKGRAASKIGDNEMAVRYYKILLEKNPEYPNAADEYRELMDHLDSVGTLEDI